MTLHHDDTAQCDLVKQAMSRTSVPLRTKAMTTIMRSEALRILSADELSI